MSLEILQIDLTESYILPIIALIAGGLFVVQAVFTYFLWRRGEKLYYMKFISFLIVSIMLIIEGIMYIVLLNAGSYALLAAMIIIFIIGVTIAAGIPIYLFVRDTWFSKEAFEEENTTKGKIKEVKA